MPTRPFFQEVVLHPRKPLIEPLLQIQKAIEIGRIFATISHNTDVQQHSLMRMTSKNFEVVRMGLKSENQEKLV